MKGLLFIVPKRAGNLLGRERETCDRVPAVGADRGGRRRFGGKRRARRYPREDAGSSRGRAARLRRDSGRRVPHGNGSQETRIPT
jgi:hypothetical protein